MKTYAHIKKEERDEISILVSKGYCLRDIARVLGRSVGTVSREIAGALGRSHSSVVREIKNRSVDGIYQPIKAQQKAYVKRKYSKYQGMRESIHIAEVFTVRGA